MLLGLYGGMMRGGNTDSTVVVGDAPIEAPPRRVANVVGDRDARRVLGAGRTEAAPGRSRARERRDVQQRRRRDAGHVHPRARHRQSRPSSGNPLGGSMVMLGAYAGITGIVEHRRARRGDAPVDPVVPHAAHRGERARAPRRLGPPARERASRPGRSAACLSRARRRSRAAARSPIDVEHCKGCELCIPACPPNVLDDVDAR